MIFFSHLKQASFFIAKFGFLGLIALIITACSTIKQNNNAVNPKNITTPMTMAMNYLSGTTVEQDPAQAVYWLKRAEQQGDMTAANALGYLYAAGVGVKQDYAMALFWYTKAADAGNASANYNLGLLYAYGLGTAIDSTKAQHYFAQAKSFGFP